MYRVVRASLFTLVGLSFALLFSSQSFQSSTIESIQLFLRRCLGHLTSFGVNHAPISQVIFGKNSCTILVPIDREFPSIIRTGCNGRLGNQLSVYATSWYFSQNHGMKPVFREDQIRIISSVFKRTNLKIDTSCKVEDNAAKKWENLYELNQDGYYFYERFKKDPGQFVKSRLLDIGRYTNALYFYKENLPELREQFQFKDDILQAAVAAMAIVKLNISSQGPSLVYVGIHCRRTDVLGSGHQPHAQYHRIGHKYYSGAMQLFRSKYNTELQQVVFLAASDDPTWLKENLARNSDVNFTEDLFGGRLPTAGEDLAVLSLCNHTIIGPGTFGQWGALLAGGEVVYPTGYGLRTTFEESVLQRAGMANWRGLNISTLSKNSRS